jgi:hypothetical protein
MEPGLAMLAGIVGAPVSVLLFGWTVPVFLFDLEFGDGLVASSVGVVTGPRDFLAEAAFGFSLAIFVLPPRPERARVGWKGDLRGREVNLLPLTRIGVVGGLHRGTVDHCAV